MGLVQQARALSLNVISVLIAASETRLASRTSGTELGRAERQTDRQRLVGLVQPARALSLNRISDLIAASETRLASRTRPRSMLSASAPPFTTAALQKIDSRYSSVGKSKRPSGRSCEADFAADVIEPVITAVDKLSGYPLVLVQCHQKVGGVGRGVRREVRSRGRIVICWNIYSLLRERFIILIKMVQIPLSSKQTKLSSILYSSLPPPASPTHFY